ncbi:MAG: hypothetical protein NC453_09395 [Muribaculum sp.]|nr:hypothetical protein [Muribaculum sp.]
MERISLYIRTTKVTGKIKLRFRLIDGRAVQIFHKSQIEADLADLKKFESDGSVKPRVSIYNEQLHIAIVQEVNAMRDAYREMKINGEAITTEAFEKRVDMILFPERYKVNAGYGAETLIERLGRFLDGLKQYKTVSSARLVAYISVKYKLNRYLIINKKTNYKPEDFKPEDILGFREFIINEYKYVEKYPLFYKNVSGRSLPTKQIGQNTATAKLRTLSVFFNELESNDEILKSPFRRLSKTRLKEVMSEIRRDPFWLTREELMTVMNTEVREELKEVKDAFLLQCALGCRISDYMKMDMSNVSVTDDGIPYVYYLAQKTLHTSSGKKEKTTPIMLYALEIIKRTGFKFSIFTHRQQSPILYNQLIRELLKECKIGRIISQYNDIEEKMEHKPLYEVGSSKLARKTHVDIASKIQINMYATGLHEAGSSAVEHYTKLQLNDLFILLSLAFNQPQYKVDKDLNVIEVAGSPANGEIETKI